MVNGFDPIWLRVMVYLSIPLFQNWQVKLVLQPNYRSCGYGLFFRFLRKISGSFFSGETCRRGRPQGRKRRGGFGFLRIPKVRREIRYADYECGETMSEGHLYSGQSPALFQIFPKSLCASAPGGAGGGIRFY